MKFILLGVKTKQHFLVKATYIRTANSIMAERKEQAGMCKHTLIH